MILTLMKIEVSINGHPLKLKLLLSPEERTKGFMFGTEPKDHEGLMFVFPSQETHSFWMKNVPFDLDVIGLSATLDVVHIGTLKANNEKSHLVPNSKYVLEVRSGWCKRNSIQIGDFVLMR